MASSWDPDLQEKIQQTRILGFVNSSVNFIRFHIPLHNPGSKVADVNVLLSGTPVVNTMFFERNHFILMQLVTIGHPPFL
jgi:hypothetical protein